MYGVVDETHQYFVPGRSSSVGDWIADIVGAIFFVVVFHYLEKRNLFKENKTAG